MTSVDLGQGNAFEAGSPEQLIEDALGEESFISALTSTSLTWTADEHRAAAHTAKAAAEELPGDEEIELAEAEAREWAESPEAWRRPRAVLRLWTSITGGTFTPRLRD